MRGTELRGKTGRKVPFGIWNGVHLKEVHTGSSGMWLIHLLALKIPVIRSSIPKDIPQCLNTEAANRKKSGNMPGDKIQFDKMNSGSHWWDIWLLL